MQCEILIVHLLVIHLMIWNKCNVSVQFSSLNFEPIMLIKGHGPDFELERRLFEKNIFFFQINIDSYDGSKLNDERPRKHFSQ